jgi:HPt (histidine-containing phosphotransfer) domain-containing protein
MTDSESLAVHISGATMLSKVLMAAYLRSLSDIISDLQVGLQSDDATEVAYEARILKRMSEECEVQKLAMTADKIEQAAVVCDFAAVRSLLPELVEHFSQMQVSIQLLE